MELCAGWLAARVVLARAARTPLPPAGFSVQRKAHSGGSCSLSSFQPECHKAQEPEFPMRGQQVNPTRATGDPKVHHEIRLQEASAWSMPTPYLGRELTTFFLQNAKGPERQAPEGRTGSGARPGPTP